MLLNRLFEILTLSVVLSAQCAGAQAEAPAPKKKPTSLSSEMLSLARSVGVGDYLYSTNKKLSEGFGSLDDGKGNRYMVLAGSEAAHETSTWIEAEMNRIGLQDVVREEFPVHAYELRGSSVTLVGTGERMRSTAMAQTPPTPPGGLTAEIVDVGNGTRQEYAGRNVRGKIVLISFDWSKLFYFNAAMYQAKLEGAIGIIYDFLGQQELPGSLYSYPLSPFEGQTIPALNVSHDSVAKIRAELAQGPLHVAMKLDADDRFEGTDHNVVGYIRGKKYPKEIIVIADHFDHYFYGSLDCGSCVSSVLGLARAFIEIGYEPDRTLAFVAHGAEENGWHTAWGPYINGAWNFIAKQHADWPGRVVAMMGWDWSGDIHSTSTQSTTFTNEMKSFLEDMTPAYDAYFESSEPFGGYYEPSTVDQDSGLSSQGWDVLAYAREGVPSFSVRAAQSEPYLGNVYHTEYDDMTRVSGEAMALGVVATGFAAIALDRRAVTPYDFSTWPARLKAKLVEDQGSFRDHGVDLEPVLKYLSSAKAKMSALRQMVLKFQNHKNATEINRLQRQMAAVILPQMEYSAGDFPYAQQWRYQQYLRDADALRSALVGLRAGDSQAGLDALLTVASAYYGSNVDYEVHKAWVDFEPYGLFASDRFGPRLPTYTDVWHLIETLKSPDEIEDANFTAQVQAIELIYRKVTLRLENVIIEMTAALTDAAGYSGEALALIH
jgi:hypothetical protein